MIFGSKCELKENTFEFKLQNKVKYDVFYEVKQEFLDFLRSKLENYEIQAEAIITAELTKAKPRTEQEKFEIMAAKNPNLNKLKEELGLDLIF